MTQSQHSLFDPSRHRLACSFFGVVVCCFSGCGDSGRYDISGAATFNGKPIPAGTIAFEPDTEKGNSGPGTMARIKNGRYKNDPGEGIVGGAYLLKIYGYDGHPRGGNMPQGLPLFTQGYQIRHEFEAKSSTYDVTVPADERWTPPRALQQYLQETEP